MSKNKYTSNPLKPSEITPEHLYLNRRKFISSLGITSAAAFLAACSPQVFQPTAALENTPAISPDPTKTGEQGTVSPSTMDEPLTDYEAVTNYNNYYEFSLDKQEVAPLSEDFKTTPWTVQIGGLVNKPLTLGIEDLDLPA